ncbi:MAG: putative selenate reductase subunit YgfK [Clostridiales bacterium]|nr:putative selenate reductase subunit YgfK [Clostridiales bacterium]
MSERMTCMSFEQLLGWVLDEKEQKNSVFGVRRPFVADPSKTQMLFGRKLETPIGPAAGPHGQLAQNLIASYYAGCRFFELKTVQIMDGAELAACINRPCITAEDECYNCEWSTELYVPEAMDEYIKAWVILHIMAKEYGLGSPDGFQFNISVGYNLEGIKSPKMDAFIEGMKEAKDTDSFRNAIEVSLSMVDRFKNVTRDDILAIPSEICNSATISTLHGCPPEEIESIANYLLKEKHLNTFIKCNPTLLGYDFARKTMDEMGYDYVAFGEFHFNDDLQYVDAVPMITRLMELSGELGLDFGLKLTNTFPVDVKANELPAEEMYMSGKSLFPLSIALAAKLSKEFGGKLRIAYSGGADYYNIDKIVGCGIWPVTMATTLLKTGGYQRCKQIAEKLNDTGAFNEFKGIDVAALEALAESAKTDKYHVKSAKELPSRKSKDQVPLIDCFKAPCKEGCPIHQDITAYVELAGQGKYAEALRVILTKNPLPFLTGTICAHNCMTKCTRNFYEEPVDIRGTKLLAAEKAYDEVIGDYKTTAGDKGKVAVVGGGPAGIAAAHFLLRAGYSVTIFERADHLGGIPMDVIPKFRIGAEAIQKDIDMVLRMGAEVRTGTNVESIDALEAEGFDAIILAMGAYGSNDIGLDGTIEAISFLADFKKTDGNVDLGSNVIVVGAGNTAMDTARAAIRNAGVEKVSIVYRRTKRYMPADEEELIEAMEDGVNFLELLSPVKFENGKLTCRKMALSDERDASGRKKTIETDELVEVAADTVISAVTMRVPTDFYKDNGIDVDERGRAICSRETSLSGRANVYVVGDGLGGPATIVEGIRDAANAASAIIGSAVAGDIEPDGNEEGCFAKKGILAESCEVSSESERCLKCDVVCENCVDVCPNRANVEIRVPGMKMAQIVHVDHMCNECGNCKVFCPYASAPYKDKFTLFANETDMEDSTNDGVVFTDLAAGTVKIRLGGRVTECNVLDEKAPVYDGIRKIAKAIYTDYSYLIVK